MSEHNLAVLRGRLTGEAQIRELATGQVVVQFDLTTRDDTGTHSVPVAWFDPPRGELAAGIGTELVVVGSVRRRFFRADGATQSRTEVVAERVVAATRRREVAKVLSGAQGVLSGPGPNR